MRTFLISLLLLAASAVPASAFTVVCSNCSTNFIQAIDRITNVDQLTTLAKQYSEDIQQTAAQLRMVQQNIERYQNMIQNTISIPRDMINNIQRSMVDLATLTRRLNTLRGDAVALGSIFTQLFPEQSHLGDLASASPEQIQAATDEYREQWDSWSAEVDRSTQATFQLSGMQLAALQDNPDKMQSYVNNLLSTPEGQMQALQSGNQLAALQLEESRQLRELMATQAQMDVAAQMKAEKESQMQEEMWRTFTTTDSLNNLTPKPDPF